MREERDGRKQTVGNGDRRKEMIKSETERRGSGKKRGKGEEEEKGKKK